MNEFRCQCRGITFVNAGPNWAPPTSEQTAIVGTNWSRGWVIEDCEVSGTECSGVTQKDRLGLDHS